MNPFHAYKLELKVVQVSCLESTWTKSQNTTAEKYVSGGLIFGIATGKQCSVFTHFIYLLPLFSWAVNEVYLTLATFLFYWFICGVMEMLPKLHFCYMDEKKKRGWGCLFACKHYTLKAISNFIALQKCRMHFGVRVCIVCFYSAHFNVLEPTQHKCGMHVGGSTENM